MKHMGAAPVAYVVAARRHAFAECRTLYALMLTIYRNLFFKPTSDRNISALRT